MQLSGTIALCVPIGKVCCGVGKYFVGSVGQRGQLVQFGHFL